MRNGLGLLLLAAGGFLASTIAGVAGPTLSSKEAEVPFNIGPVKADPVRNIAYVVDSSNNRILAIDLSSGQQVYAASIDDGTTFGDIAISVDDSKLYLAESTKNEIMVFSLPSLSPLPTLPLGYSPGGIASAVGGRLFTTEPNSNLSGFYLVVEIDPSTGNTVQTFGNSENYQTPPLLRINAAGTDLYATTPDDGGFMYEYNLNVSPIATPTSYNFASDNLKDFAPDESYGRVYVAQGSVYGIQLLLTANDDYSTVWPFTGAYGIAVSYNATSNIVYGGSGDLYAGDIRTFNRTDGTPLNDYVVCTDTYTVKPRGLAATANGNALYVRALESDSGISVIGVLGSLTQPVTLYPTVIQTITFPSLGTQTAGTAVVLQATDSAGLPLIYSVVSGPAIISGNTVVFTGIGTVVIAASQAGNSVDLSARTTQTITVVGKPQTIAPFASISTQTYGVSPITITPPLSTSGLAVTVTVQSGPATISGNSLTITGAGTVTLAADQPGNSFYAPAPEVTTTFTVDKASQTISAFKTIATQTYSPTPITITMPTASSGLPVTVSVLSGPATLSGTSLTLTGAGTVVLAADQSGNANYNAAAEVTTSFVVSGASQKISAFKTISSKNYTTTPFTITLPTSNSGLPVTVTVLSGPATISGNEVTLTGVGKVELGANQPGNNGYSAAPQVTTTFTVKQASQTITSFQSISKQTYGVAPFAITLPTSSSGLAVTTTVKSGPATLTGNVVTVTGAGTVKLVANQSGNSDYKAATQVSISFTVDKASQTLTSFPAIATQSYGEAPFTITPPTSNSGLAVTVKIDSGPAKISGNAVTITGVGTVKLKASQAGDDNYDAATSETTTFTVVKGSQTIAAFASIPTQTYGEAAFKVTAPAASSGLTVTLSVLSGPAKISGSDKVTLTGTGTVTLQATQSGNSDYNAATPVTTSFSVVSS